jgi:heptosyltransferase-2
VLWIDDAVAGRNWLNGMRQLVRALKQHQFSTVWVLHHSPRYALACWLAGIPHRYGYATGYQRLFLNKGMALPKGHKKSHPIDKAEIFLTRNKIINKPVFPKLTIENLHVNENFLAHPKPWIALGIGCSEPDRQWGKNNFARLCQEIAPVYHGTIFIVGGAAERTDAAWIVAQAGKSDNIVQVINHPLDEVCALLGMCDLFVGNDTGMLNVAAATGTPSIGLFFAPISQRLADERRNIFPIFPESPPSRNESGIKGTITPQHVIKKIEAVKDVYAKST